MIEVGKLTAKLVWILIGFEALLQYFALEVFLLLSLLLLLRFWVDGAHGVCATWQCCVVAN